jgi:ATP-dependent Clp protease ATP-binding subunit ClpA
LDPLQILEREQEVVASASAAFDRDAVEAETRREQSGLQSLEAEVSYLRQVSARSHHQVAGQSNQIGALSQQLQAAREDLVALQATTSWRLTKPLRWARTRARRLK